MFEDHLSVTARLAIGSGSRVGLVVLSLEHLVGEVLHRLFEAPVWVPQVR